MIKNDTWIKQQAENGMIYPFTPELIREEAYYSDTRSVDFPSTSNSELLTKKSVISYGLSSFGYDIRLSPKEFKVFRHVPGTIVNPKNFNPHNLESVVLHQDPYGEYFILPAHSYGLGVALECLAIPNNITVICMGKSTYARCFTGDTKVKLVDGNFTFLQLIERIKQGDTLYGYGVKDGRITVQELTQPRFIEYSSLVEVELDSGETIKCTPDHKFLLRSGRYVEACSLKKGDSLYPIYDAHSHGYPAVFDSVLADSIPCRARAMKPVHKMVAECQVNGYERGVHVHHQDENVYNNHPSNLVLLTPSQHAKLHNLEDQRYIRGGEKFRELYNSDSDFRENINKSLHSEDAKRKAALGREKHRASNPDAMRLNQMKSSKVRWSKPEQRKAQSELAKKNFSRSDVNSESLTSALLEAGTIRGAARLLKVDRSAFRRFPEIMEEFKEGRLCYNHKVVAVRDLGLVEPTYCLTAPDTGNFALSCGVFVSNCGIIANLTPGEAGWRGHLTLEFSNSSSADARIYANEGVVQLLFLEGEPCETSYCDRKGKYQDQSEEIVLAKV